MREDKRYLLLLTVSWIALFIKGVNYLILGRWIVIAIGLFFLFSWLMAYKTKRGMLLVLRTWSVGLIMWSLVRLMLSAMILFFQKIPELHANQQFGLSSLPITFTVLIVGVVLFRNANAFIDST